MAQAIGYILVVGFILALSISFLLHVFGYLYEKQKYYIDKPSEEEGGGFKLYSNNKRTPQKGR